MTDEFKGYSLRREGTATALVHCEGADRIADALLQGRGCVPAPVAGRGAMRCFPWTEARSGLVRIYLRGGLMGGILKDRFFLHNRPLAEFRAHVTALERGVAAPALLGVCWRRSGLFYSGAIATELLHGTDLDAWLRVPDRNNAEIEATLRACGTTIRHMHEVGMDHADLQIKNILITDQGPVLLDFDRARVLDHTSDATRARNLLRLRRSLETRGFPVPFFEMVCAGYDGKMPPRWLDRLYRAKGHLSSMVKGRRGKFR